MLQAWIWILSTSTTESICIQQIEGFSVLIRNIEATSATGACGVLEQRRCYLVHALYKQHAAGSHSSHMLQLSH